MGFAPSSTIYFSVATLPLIIFFLFCSTRFATVDEPLPAYMARRDKILAMERARRTGNNIIFSEKEKNANNILTSMKDVEFNRGLRGEPFPPAMHFFDAKPLIDRSEVFDIIRMMPKGAALHLHDVALASIPWVISELTYLPDLYYCQDTISESLHFRFFSQIPLHTMKNCTSWELVANARNLSRNATQFDDLLFYNLSMITKEPHLVYPDTYKAWKKFKPCLFQIAELLYTEECFERYVLRALHEFYDDNVQYMEIRYGINQQIRTGNGTQKSKEYTLNKYIDTVRKFQEQRPDFIGAKFISQSFRFVNNTKMEEDITRGMLYRRTYPEYYAGHDIVVQEDKGYPLLHYINELLFPSRENVSLPFFFHAGETGWQGTYVDENIFDAILLNTCRIGHGYAITKHPVAMELVKSNNIAIEVNPISNQVLGLVGDLRNHPAALLLAQDFPVVITSDDPAPWGAAPMSHDFYQTFMGLGGKSADLATLKQLALNSIKYSATTESEKTQILAIWTKKWEEFLDAVNAKYGTKYLQKNRQQ